MLNKEMLVPPLPIEQARTVSLSKGPNIASLPEFAELPDEFELPVLLKVGDGISTDGIDPTYPSRAREAAATVPRDRRRR